MKNEIVLKNNSILTLDRAIHSDANAIVEYTNIVGGESDNLTFGKNEFRMTVLEEELFINNINKTDNSIIIVGKIDNEIVSVGTFMSNNRARIKHQATIGISVKKSYWSLGIGTALMEELIAFGKKHKITKVIRLEVLSENINAIKLYRKLGFEELGLFKKYFYVNDEYKDAIFMNYYID